MSEPRHAHIRKAPVAIGRIGRLQDEERLFGGRLSVGTLLRAAARCSRSELPAERNVGRTTVDAIERRLASRGRSLRPDADSLEAAPERAIGHLEGVIETRDADAPLEAVLAIPELKRALRVATARTA